MDLSRLADASSVAVLQHAGTTASLPSALPLNNKWTNPHGWQDCTTPYSYELKQVDLRFPMAVLSDLPPEILTIIFQDLPPSELISTCLVSKQVYKACLPLFYASFKGSSNPKQTWRRFQLFLEIITRDDALGRHVKSVLINETDNHNDNAAVQGSIGLLLSQAPNIQQFAIPGRPDLLPLLKRQLALGGLPLQQLRDFRCVNYGPEIWEIIHHFPQLSRLTLRYHSCGPSTLQLPVSSLPIEHILLEGCDLGSQALCAVIRSCKRLLRFHYLRPLFGQEAFLGRAPLNAQDIYEALLLHKDHLGELVMQDHDYRMRYDETPKFGSFADFYSLQRLGVDCNTITMQASLPPNLRSIAIRHCSSYKSADVLLYLASHPLVEAIQFDDVDGGAATFFQQSQALGHIRKEIQVHLVSAFTAYARRPGLQNLVNYSLRWNDPAELH